MKIWSLTEGPVLYAYLPWTQRRAPWQTTVVARGNLPPAEIAGVIRDEVLALDPDLMVASVGTMDDHLRYIYFLPRMAALAPDTRGRAGSHLACLGLYGMVSYGVSRRTREMGIRLALGADRQAVVTLVLKGAMALVLVGGVVGVVAALGFGRLVERFLLGVNGLDPMGAARDPGLAWSGGRAGGVDPCAAGQSEWIRWRRCGRNDGGVVDMCDTCEHAGHMSTTMIQIRNVPNEVHRAAKARAATEGLSLSDFALRALEREIARPTLAEIAARVRLLPRMETESSLAEMVREERDSR